MYFAKNNIVVPLDSIDFSTYAIMNPLSGSFDLLEKGEYEQILAGKAETLAPELATYLGERGYVFNSKEDEDVLVQKEWELFQEETANTQVQLLLIPSYGCNIACKYCYQAGMEAGHNLIKPEVVDAFFDYAENTYANNTVKPFVTLFGGEPLIDSPTQREIVSLIVDRCVEHGYELAAVSNGYDLANYVDLLARAKVKEIQVTLDGTKDVHDQRRGTANGKGTFDRIVAGIDAALARGIPINLRSVVDQENINDLVSLAEFFDSKGWLDLPPNLFKTQIGRNYELFDCYAKPQHLLSQADLWREFSKLSQKYPVLKKFHRPDFKGIRHLVDTGEMYMASFDTCPAAKTEWVFDLNGDIYGCTASCGREEYKLGTFYPEVTARAEETKQWQQRNVNNIEECRDCKYNVICGGGCGVIAANKTGRILAPDCRPIQELIETGVDYYREEILQMADGHTEAACCSIEAKKARPILL
ncbi:MAG: radical SAM protein [Acidobacteriota bacterium]